MAGILKTTVRCTVILPDNYGRVQRLYDYGTWFDLDREIITDVDKLANLVTELQRRGGKLIAHHEYIDDDDFKEKQSFTYEYIG